MTIINIMPETRAPNCASVNGSAHNDGEIRIPSASRKSMLVWLTLELWKQGRLDLRRLIHAKGRKPQSQKQALRILNRASAADLEPLVAEILNGDRLIIEGPVQESRERKLVERLGAFVDDGAKAGAEAGDNRGQSLEPIRFIDMTPALLGFAAVIMALRYLALGLSDRELYVMAGIGYAAFILIRTFSYKLKRPKNAPMPEEISRQPSAVR
jgi:hypothetical protein